MAQYTQTKISRLFQYDPDKLKLVHRAKPLPPTPREARRFDGFPFPVMVSRGQRINLYKEYKRQMKRQASLS